MARTATAQKQPQKTNNEKRLIMLFVRQISIFAVSLAIVIASVLFAFNVLYRELLRPVNPQDSTEVLIEIPMGSSLARIADLLSRNDLIRNDFVFELFAEFTDQAHKLRAGEYSLSRDMNMQQIIDRLMEGKAISDTVRFRIPEGYTISEMADLLYALTTEDGNKMFEFTAQEFIDSAKDLVKYIDDFNFLDNIPLERREGQYPLEGYLFPDTYEAYKDASPEDIVRMMLRTFGRKVYDREFNETTIAARANVLDMTIDEVIVLASIIQAEAGFGEFHKVSAVFQNRLNVDMPLQSCSTVLYLIPREEWEGPFATDAQIEATIDSKYNTYKNLGLPVGPISAPSQLAVEAVLFPYEDYMTDQNKMLFFVYRGDGTHEFSETYAEHQRAIEEFEHLWR